MAKVELSGIPTAAEAPEIIGVPPSDHLAAGRVLGGRYEIRGRLGAGGMGAVYRAYDRELQEDIALKIIFTARRGHTSDAQLQLASTVRAAPFLAGSDIVDQAAIERLRREVKLARQITHTNVCRVFDLGESDGLYFLTMELVEGKTLREWLAAGPLPPDRALHLLEQIAEGLSAAHAQGIVHGDLKPENVLVREDGRAVVADFGISRKLHLDAAENPRREGTPAYMSPEQLRGESIDVRSDVFTLGVVGFEVLAGQRPFEGGAPGVLTPAILAEPPQLDVPGLVEPVLCALREVFARALAADSDQRFQSAAEFGVALSLARRATAPHSTLERVSKPEPIPPRELVVQVRRGLKPWLPRGLLALLVLLAIGFGAWMGWREKTAEPVVVRVAMAVLPFENTTRDAEGDALARRATESIAAGLRTIPQVWLPDTAPADRGQAKAQGIVFLVRGSVRRMDPVLHLRAEIEAVDEADRVPIVEPIEIDIEPGKLSESVEALRHRALDEGRLAVRHYERRRRAIQGTASHSAREKLLGYYAMVGLWPQQEHYKEGFKLVDEALAADGQYVPARVERAYLRVLGAGEGETAERYASALVDLDVAQRNWPNDAEAAVARCRILQKLMEMESYLTDAAIRKATDACETALSVAPASAHVYLKLARIHDRQCRDNDAMRELERAVELDRSVSHLALKHLVDLAMLNDRLLVAERSSAALVAFQAEEQRLGPRALSRRAGEPEVPGTYRTPGALLLRLGRFDEAKVVFNHEIAEVANSEKDSWAEAAGIRGLMVVAAAQKTPTPKDHERRVQTIEARLKTDPDDAMTLALAYAPIDPAAAARLIDPMGAPNTCEDAFYRVAIYQAAGQSARAKAALEACTPHEQWERDCAIDFGARLSR